MCRFRVRLQFAPNNKSSYIEANKEQENYYPTSAVIYKKKNTRNDYKYITIYFDFPHTAKQNSIISRKQNRWIINLKLDIFNM